MTVQDILISRLHNEQLTSAKFHTPSELVTWFGAVQSQDYSGAKWALAQRLPHTYDADIESAFTRGEILRTHVLRPTWHFVAPQDIRWMLELTAPRVKKVMSYYNRQLGLTDALFIKTQNIMRTALVGNKALTRDALCEVMSKEGIAVKGQAMGHIAMWAELDGVICSGPRQGKQFTYMLLEERVSPTQALTRDEALMTVTKRYYTSHGPATIRDFVWWSGLTTDDVKRGLAMNDRTLAHEIVEGKEYWYAESIPVPMPQTVYLLPNYDEYAIAYKDRDIFFNPKYTIYLDARENTIFQQMIFYRGKIIGLWRRTIKKNTVEIEVKFFMQITKAVQEAFDKAVKQYGTYLNLQVKCTQTAPEGHREL